MKNQLISILLCSSLLAACGGSDHNSSKSSASASSVASSVVSSSTSSTSSEVASSASSAASFCSTSEYYFCDDFSQNTTDNWDLLPANINEMQPDGSWDLVADNGNNVLRYTAASSGGVLALVKPAAFSGVTSADYYVEAKIRPRKNGTTSNKQLYILARYVDGKNWYAGALNVQNAETSTQVEIATMIDGALSRPQQIKKPIVQGEAGMLDGVWYSLRLELMGNVLTVYLDGETIATYTDEDNALPDAGLIGFWTSNKSFEVDDIIVGDASNKPASLLISPSDVSYAAEVGDAPRVISVAAKTNTGTADTYTVVSSNPEIVGVSVEGTEVTLTPLAAGDATITFTSSSELVRTISAAIAPQFVMPTATYDLNGLTAPAIGETNAYEDTSLKITFDSQPTLGSAGSIRIFNAADDTLVDTVKLTGESDSLGFDSTLRTINTKPVWLNGNTGVVSLHSNKLAVNTTYYVAISPSVFTGATLDGKTFDGIGKASGWTFTTRSSAPAAGLTAITVDDDGFSADFRSVQGALNYAMKNNVANEPVTINLMNGTYQEPLYLSGKSNLTIHGESREGVVIQYPDNELLNSGSTGRALFLVEGVDMLTLDNLTLKNTTLIGNGGQAETIYFNSPNGRLLAKNSSFISEQDTLLLKGWAWFYNSLVAGNVDFIWGYPKAVLFEKSEIRTIGRSTGNTNGGYVLQARIEQATDKGFVFLNSSLTSGEGPTGEVPLEGETYLARSPGGSSTYDNVVFVNTKMDTHIAPRGWAGLGVNNQPAANPSTATATTGWREYGSMDMSGSVLDVSAREFGYQLNLAEVAGYCSRAAVFSAFGGGSGWDPMPSDTSNCVDIEGTGSGSSSSSSSSSAPSWTGTALQLGGSATSISGSVTTATDDSVTFTAAGGKFESAKTAIYLVSKMVTGDFTLTAKVKSVGTLRENASYQFPTGLMMCECDLISITSSPYAHASINDLTEDTTVNLVATYGHILADGGSWGKTGNAPVTPGDSLYLKLTRTDQSYGAYYSTDGGATYTALGGSTFTDLPATIKVGIFAAPNGSGAQSFTYEDIQLIQ